MLSGLSLFSGIGGIDLALKEYVRPVAYCEIEPYAAGVLFSRMLDGSLFEAPIWPDVRTLRGALLSHVDIIYGGFPCQDISVAGRGKGLEGERSGLFFEIVRLVGELRPRFVFLENVPAITSRGGWRVVGELAALGYGARWGVLSAYDVGAPHVRERWWCLAYADDGQWRSERDCSASSGREAWDQLGGGGQELADTSGTGCQEQHATAEPERSGFDSRSTAPIWRGAWWTTEPDVGRVVNGLPYRVDRIKGLGNAVVPQCAKEAFKRLLGLKQEQEER